MTAVRSISITEAARVLGISRNYAYRLVREDRFPVPTFPVGSLTKVNADLLAEYVTAGERVAS